MSVQERSTAPSEPGRAPGGRQTSVRARGTAPGGRKMSVAARRAPAAFAALICCCALLIAGCGDSGDGEGTTAGGDVTAAATAPGGEAAGATDAAGEDGTPVTDEQALVLARLLQLNWQRGGADVSGSLPVQGTEVVLEGKVDFRDGRGDATLVDPTGQERRYVWTRRAVFAQSAPGSEEWERQAPDPDGDPVHGAIRLLNLLSAETIDNTTNIKDQDARHLGEETVDGERVDVYRYGADGATTYWVGRDGLLRQVEAVFPDDVVMTFALSDHRPVRVKVPGAGG
jgi:hypothetical protein